jgi:hypothetical protein
MFTICTRNIHVHMICSYLIILTHQSKIAGILSRSFVMVLSIEQRIDRNLAAKPALAFTFYQHIVVRYL